jgi:hypothetical protein
LNPTPGVGKSWTSRTFAFKSVTARSGAAQVGAYALC